MESKRISFIGSGNVGSALCLEFFRKGCFIEKIASATPTRGKELADSCGAIWSDNLIFPESTNVIIVAVPDKELQKVLNAIVCSKQAIVLHTAGSYGLDVFPETLLNIGVLYPLQTFSPGRSFNFSEIPFFIEASNDYTLNAILELSSVINSSIFKADTEKRQLLHLAAVFACNFTNHLMTISQDIATSAGFDRNILNSLIKETFNKALVYGGQKSQTGPAVRNDNITMDKHIRLLSSNPVLENIYKNLSESIINNNKK
ncbi:MAG TPA: Rossmann-like and DUF2520 domain-containing protein [Bacteroidales bacterium]|nr:Rossmann-like and DUF2520 domain-containing protein [Bacteroidales bacterium]